MKISFALASLGLAALPLLASGPPARAEVKVEDRVLVPTSKAERRAVPFTDVHLTDNFWAPKEKIYRQNTIPNNWKYLQQEIEDNEIAAGWKHIERGSDTPWNQANLFKALETVAYALPQEPNPELQTKLDGIIKAVAGAQQPNGYINALITVRHMTPWTNLDGQHEGFVAGHMIEAAVAHYQATGQRSFLNVAMKMADHIYQHFIVEKNPGVCGHAELELALVRLYRVTGEKKYLQLAQNWIERRGHPLPGQNAASRSYFMDHLPIRAVPEVTGHAVRTVYYLTGVADVAAETGDVGLAQAARRLWNDATRRKMYVVGSVGSQEKDEGFGPDYDLPNSGYNESCAACGMLNWAQSMWVLDGESSSIDVLERGLYNAVLHGLSLDGTTSYYRNPLSDANSVRNNVWVCCPPNLSRTLMRVPGYLYAQTTRDIYVNLFASSTCSIKLANTRVQLAQETNYPWDGQIKITVKPDKPAPFALRLRIPGWCPNSTLELNGKPILKPAMEKGYAVLLRLWRAGDVVELKLPMPVQRIQANPKVLEDKGQVALQRGPIVYGFEALDNAGRVDVQLAREAGFTTQARPDLLGGVTTISGRAGDGRSLTAIPFYALANREPSKQAVWMAQQGQLEQPKAWPDEQMRTPVDSWEPASLSNRMNHHRGSIPRHGCSGPPDAAVAAAQQHNH